MTKNNQCWSRTSWQNYPAFQQPSWPNKGKYGQVLETNSGLPPLVFAGEIRELKTILGKVVEGNAFLLQGGDCSEEFLQCNSPNVRGTLKILLQMEYQIAEMIRR